MSWIDYWYSANGNLAVGLFLFSYVLGCFTSGYYFVRWFTDQDIRLIGSGNVGARNVGRLLGKKGFFLTVVCDVFKGVLAVWVAHHFTNDPRIILLSMIAVVAGHVWPLQLRFHGGKGMATSIGTLLAFDPQLAAVFAVLFIALLPVFRRTVLPGLIAMACLPLADVWLHPQPAHVTLLSAWAAIVLLAHRRNFVEEFSLLAARRNQPQPEQSQP
ncbi:MAG TPA: glycerol-3-phosphate acyltransferase [Verrucomicrobiae bacterium]|nr:glycerol-3-phosphate acyltransferase [Verrucomicrobiae bacterium]